MDRLLGEHGIQQDTAAGRAEFERRMESRRREKNEAGQWEPLRRGWVLGSAEFRAKLLEQLAPHLGEHHSGKLRQESVAAKGERVIAEELKRAKWKEKELLGAAKSHPAKLALAGRLRRETTLTIRQIAGRLHMGSWKSLSNKLYLARKQIGKAATK